jgi:hypothetical protein
MGVRSTGKTDSGKKNGVRIVVIAFLWLCTGILLLTAGYSVFLYLYQRLDAGTALQNYIQDTPRLVFRQVEFAKYLIRGSPDGTDQHLSRLQMLYVRGTADFEFDLTRLSVDSGKTNRTAGVLSLLFDNGAYFPVTVNVEIPQKNVFLIDSIAPQAITEGEAEKGAAAAGAVTGTVGGLLGMQLGGLIGGKTIIGGLAGTVVGSVAGAATAGSAGYVMTKNFLTGLQLAENTLGAQEELLESVKPLIALELMNGDYVSTGGSALLSATGIQEWKSTTRSFYRQELETVLQDFFSNLGWKTVSITYTTDKD